MTKKKTKTPELYLFLSLVEFLRPRQTGQVQRGGAAPSCCCPGEMKTTFKAAQALFTYSHVGVCAHVFAIEAEKSQLFFNRPNKGGGIFVCNHVKVCREGAFVPDGVIVVTAGVMPASL